MARLGMLECHDNIRPPTDAFNRFQIPMVSAVGLTKEVLDAEIRNKHGYLSFQHPDKVSDAIRLFSNVELWKSVGAELANLPRRSSLTLGSL
jgi:hypothetical protein